MPRRKFSLANFEKYQPFGRPDWAWYTAHQLVAEGKYAKLERDGETVCRLIKYHRCERDGFYGRSWWRLKSADPTLIQTVKFRNEGLIQPLELHCRLLARQSPGVIACEMNLNKDLVTTYRDVFFDIGHRLASPVHIFNVVIGLKPPNVPSAEQFMLLSAYQHGPLVIPEWIDWWEHQRDKHNIKTKEGRSREAIQLFVDSQRLPVNENTSRTLRKLLPEIAQTGAKTFRPRFCGEILRSQNDILIKTTKWFDHAASSQSETEVTNKHKEVVKV